MSKTVSLFIKNTIVWALLTGGTYFILREESNKIIAVFLVGYIATNALLAQAIRTEPKSTKPQESGKSDE